MKQHVTPVIIQNEKAIRLEKIPPQEKTYNESWIQSICYENPNLLPIDEIEPSFGGIVSVCRELSTESGLCDLIFLNEQGFITLGECKLWRNPEARRKVIGQILDYAKDLAKWDYQKFESECLKSRNISEESLYSVMQEYYPDIIENDFIDQVQNNLSRGRFLLLIIGDGIRENMEDLVHYIQGNGGLNFTLSMIEMPVYKNPLNQDLIITPRVLVKTKEIERTVIKLIETSTLEEQTPEETESRKSRSVSEKDFYERLEKARGQNISKDIENFLSCLNKEYGIIPKVGRGNRLSLNIKSANDTYNFGSIQETGEVWFYGLVTKTEELGNRQIGIDYLKKLADIIKGNFDDSYKQWNWCIKRNGNYIIIDEYLKKKEEWKQLIENTLENIQHLEQE